MSKKKLERDKILLVEADRQLLDVPAVYIPAEEKAPISWINSGSLVDCSANSRSKIVERVLECPIMQWFR